MIGDGVGEGERKVSGMSKKATEPSRATHTSTENVLPGTLSSGAPKK